MKEASTGRKKRLPSGFGSVLRTVLMVLLCAVLMALHASGSSVFASTIDPSQSGPGLNPAASIKDKAEAAVKQFHKEVDDWGKANTFHDTYDGKDYPLDFSYMTKGVGEDLDRALSAGSYQEALTDANDQLFQLHMLQEDSKDNTTFDKVHQTDMKLLDHYQLRDAKVIVVSTVEQALRFYDKGQLARATLVTAGEPELPVETGLWPTMWRVTDIEFKSPYPKGTPFYYDPVKVKNAIMYHEGGYFVHDAWWRAKFGPGTEFPHADPTGTVRGTHGCVNVPKDQMKWLYDHTDYQTMILIY